MSVSTPSAADFVFSSEWRRKVCATSSGVMSLPLWNVTPLRILKRHSAASSLASHDSQSTGCAEPSSGDWTIMVSPQVRPKFCGTWVSHWPGSRLLDRKSTRLNSSHVKISYAVFCLKKKKKKHIDDV